MSRAVVGSFAFTRGDTITSSVQAELTKSFSSAQQVALQYPQYATAITEGAKTSFLAGADMRDLYHLTGIPIPETPAYRLAGQLDYADHKFRFCGFRGVVG